MTGSVRRAALVLLLAVFSMGTAALAAPSQTDDPPPATIALAARTAWLADDRPVALDVAIDGDTAGTTMRVRIHPPLETADDLEASQEGDVGGITRSIDLGPTDEIPTADDGTRRIDLTADDIRLPGVHPVVVELRSVDGGVLGMVRTPVIRLDPDEDAPATPALAIVVDIAVPPTLEPSSRRELTSSEVARLERLADFLDLVTALDAPPPITIVAVPDTIEALAASTDPRAVAVLASVADAALADTTTLVAHPYVAVSAGALADAGLGDVIDTATDVGVRTLTDRLGATPDLSRWPDGDVTPEAATILEARGVRTVLTTTSAPDDPDDRGLVPAGPRPVPSLSESGLEAIVGDDSTARSLLAPVGERADAAVVAVATLLLRDDGRGTHAAVRVDDVPDDALLRSLAPLLTEPDAPVSIADLPTERPEGDVEGSGPFLLPTGSADDLTLVADRYRAVDDSVATYDTFAGTDSPQTAALRLRQLTSVADGIENEQRIALLDEIDEIVGAAFGAVALTGQTDLNLTSRSGSLPIAVQNDGADPVQVMVRIRSDRLRFPDGEEFEIVAGPDVTRIDIPVEALATGSVPTFVEVRTPDGAVLLDQRQLNVRSTAVSGVGLALSIGALTVLAVWWARTWRKGRKSGTSGADEGVRGN